MSEKGTMSKRTLCTTYRFAGFTLIELVIVVAIIGILTAIYLEQIRSSRRSDGQAKLLEVMQAQERYYTVHNAYSLKLKDDLGYPTESVPSDSGWYNISAAPCGAGVPLSQCVQLTATAQNDQANDACGNLTLNARGQWQRSGSAPESQCF